MIDRPSAIGHRPSAIGHRPSAIDHRIYTNLEDLSLRKQMRINSLEIRKLLIHEDSKLIEEFLEQWIPENEENSDIEVEDIIKNFFDYFQLVRINQDKINNNLIQLPISKIQESNN